jgi:hypothetical protein
MHDSIQQTPQRFGESMNQFNSAMFSSPIYWANAVLGIMVYTLLLLTVYGYVVACMAKAEPGEDVTPAEVWAIVRREFVSTFFSQFGLMLVVVVASMLLLIPGIYLGVALSLFYVVKLVEGTGFTESFQRSLYLVKGKWWSTFGLICISLGIMYLLIIVLSIPMGIMGAKSLLSTDSAPNETLTLVVTAIYQLTLLAAYPFVLLPVAFQYFNLVERKESRGLYAMVEQLGQPVAAGGGQPTTTWRADEEGEY